MSFSNKIYFKILLSITFILSSHNALSHPGGHEHNSKRWYFQNSNEFIEGEYVSLDNGNITLSTTNKTTVKYPLESFICSDQMLILNKSTSAFELNKTNKELFNSKKTSLLKITKARGWFILFLFLVSLSSLLVFFIFLKYKKFSVIVGSTSLFFLVLIACSSDDDSNPLSPNQVLDNSVNTSSSSSTTSSDNSSSSSSTTSSDNSSNSSEISIETITSYFSAFTDVSITSDDSYFYVNSYSWPNHQMGIGITSWQEQVPVPQNYTGDNSWRIPLNPVMSDNPIDTSVNLFRGAIAIAINGIPIFNVLNNRGENSYEKGELDNWGGHFGRGDDYHYHLIPTHLEDLVGTDQPLGYALDGYPIYGFTDNDLDVAFGRYDENGNYRYHASENSPYYMPYVMGIVEVLDDGIEPQPSQNPVRPSDGFKPVNGASVTGFSQTDTNAFSFEYTVDGVKYYVNYNWDENCNFTFTYVDEFGGTTNLPHNGAIPDDSNTNTETYKNEDACKDVTYVNYNDDSTESSQDNSSSGFSAVSENSSFTLSSIAIDKNGEVLDDYKCEEKVNGIEKSIPISWSNVPETAKSLAISIHAFIKDDEINSYLTLWGIDPSISEIAYGEANNGSWFMGPNKDGTKISYSSPCSPNGATSTYYMNIYALSETPNSLPLSDDLSIDYSTLLTAIESVNIIDSVQLTYTAD